MSVAPALLRPATEPVRRPLARTVLVALTLAITLSSLRLLFPHLYALKESSSLAVVLAVALGVAVSPVLVAPLRRYLGYESALVATTVALAGWRLLVQVADGQSVVAAAIGAVAGLTALALLLSGAEDEAVTLGAGLLGGLALDALVLGGFGTWDPIWQRGLDPVVLALVEVAALGGALALHVRALRGSPGEAGTSAAGGVAFGGVLALEVLFLANPGFVAAATGRSLAQAVSVVAAALALATVMLTLVPATPRLPAVVAASILAGAGLLLPELDGELVVAVVLLAQAGAGVVLGRSLAPAPTTETAAELSVAAGLFAALVGVLLFQIHYDLPLPVDNRWVTAVLGGLAVLAAIGPRSPEPSRAPAFGRRVAGAVAVGGLAVGLVLGAVAPRPPEPAASGTVRIAQWNVRQAVDSGGALDPEAVARALEAHEADVMVLNEVGRGWPISGQLDLASWLGRRLDVHTAWAGAASRQFGNLVLSRHPILDVERVALPVAGDAQGRSALVVTLATDEGPPLRVVATHLQHRNDDAARAARMAEVDRVLGLWGGEQRTVLAGDLNPRQGDPPLPARIPARFEEIAAILAAGLTTTGELDGCTHPTTPRNCSDYVFVSPDLVQGPVVVAEQFGDHHLLVTDVTLT